MVGFIQPVIMSIVITKKALAFKSPRFQVRPNFSRPQTVCLIRTHDKCLEQTMESRVG